jgi:septum formation protein
VIALASASVVRARLLREAGINVEVVSTELDEEALKAECLASGIAASDLARRLAESKARAGKAPRSAWVIGADQTLEVEGAVISKAGNLGQARDQLRRLRGKPHRLHTAAALARAGKVVWTGLSSPRLIMRDFSDEFLDHYLETAGGALLGAVGCYHLEGLGAQLFDRIEGDYFAVLGLPLLELLDALRAQGALER